MYIATTSHEKTYRINHPKCNLEVMLSVEGQPKRGLDNSPSVRRLVKENIEQMVWNYSLSQVFENSKTVVVEGTAPKELVRATLISHSIYYKLNPEIMDKVMDAFLSTC